MKNLNEMIGRTYEDHEGIWEVKKIDEELQQATVLNIEEGNINEGKEFVVAISEVAYWLGAHWYAVEVDEDDNDWGTGSYDLDEAKEMARNYGPEARIAVISQGIDPVCVDVITQDEF